MSTTTKDLTGIERMIKAFSNPETSIKSMLSANNQFAEQADKMGVDSLISGENSFGGIQKEGIYQLKLAQDGAKRGQLRTVETKTGKAMLFNSVYVVPMQNGNNVSTSGNKLDNATETLQTVPPSFLKIWDKDVNAVITTEVKKSEVGTATYYNLSDPISGEAQKAPTTSIEDEYKVEA